MRTRSLLVPISRVSPPARADLTTPRRQRTLFDVRHLVESPVGVHAKIHRCGHLPSKDGVRFRTKTVRLAMGERCSVRPATTQGCCGRAAPRWARLSHDERATTALAALPGTMCCIQAQEGARRVCRRAFLGPNSWSKRKGSDCSLRHGLRTSLTVKSCEAKRKQSHSKQRAVGVVSACSTLSFECGPHKNCIHDASKTEPSVPSTECCRAL